MHGSQLWISLNHSLYRGHVIRQFNSVWNWGTNMKYGPQLAAMIRVKLFTDITYGREQLELWNHRRRIETEGKAKVVASVWGAVFVQFLAALAECFAAFASVYLEGTVEFSRSIWKKRLNSTGSFKTTETKHLARQGIEQILPPKQTQRALPCLLFQSFFYGKTLFLHLALSP